MKEHDDEPLDILRGAEQIAWYLKTSTPAVFHLIRTNQIPVEKIGGRWTRDFNPTLDQKVIDRAMERDPEAARAEYFAEFRTDVQTFLAREVIEHLVEPNCHERPAERGNSYIAFCDPSGGSSDAMTLGIAHTEGSTQILDVLRERRPPFSPEAVVNEFSKLMRDYRVSKCYGDRYGGQWVSEQFMKQGVFYEPCELSKSKIYLDVLPLINSGAVELLDNERMISQFAGLERRTARGGQEFVDHMARLRIRFVNETVIGCGTRA